MAEVAKRQHIPFIGIEYTAVREFKNEEINKKRAEFQFYILKKEHKRLSDSEVDKIMRELDDNL